MFLLLILSCLAVRHVNGVTISAVDPHVRYIGRVSKSAQNVQFEWPATSITFAFSGSSFVNAIMSGGDSNQYDVVLNGTWTSIFYPSKGTNVISNLNPSSTYSLTLKKRTEALFGTVTFEGFELQDGALVYSAQTRPRALELIGASWECGYGVLGTYPCSFTADTENVFLAYGGLVADELNADLYAIAWSGRGLVRNYGDPSSTSAEPLPVLYPYVLPSQKQVLWNVSETQLPNAVLVNLGINDYSTTPHPDESVFLAGAVSFLEDLRSTYGPLMELVVLCLYSNPTCGTWASAINSLNDKHIRMIHMENGIDFNPVGCDYHPSVGVQKQFAGILAPQLKSLLGW